MRTTAVENTCLIILCSMLMNACGSKTETKIITVPQVTTVELPVVVPGEKEIIKVPELIVIDKSVGIKSLPKSISMGSPDVQSLGKSVGKVFSAAGASGSGFFISKDGLFLTNEHVIPISACVDKRCPGFKIVTGFHKDGATKTYSNFEVLAQDDNQYDFALIKVYLEPNEVVDYLDLELSKKSIDQISTDALVFGHPGGASLHFAEAKPTELPDVSIRFLGIVIPGNSGGPLVDVKTKKVVGLVKSMRTMPSKDGSGSAFFENFNQGTAIWELNNLIERYTGSSILTVKQSTDMKDLNRASTKLAKPDEDEFGQLLRRPRDDARVHALFAKFMRLIGSEHEQLALSLMLSRSEKHNGSIVLPTFNRLMNLSLAVGRPFNFGTQQLADIEIEIKSLPQDMAAKTALILLNYFDGNKRQELQKNCLSGLGDTPQMLMLAPYACYSTQLADGRSIFPIYADWLVNKSGFKTLDQLSSSTALLMTAGPIGLQNQQEAKAVEVINNYINENSWDLYTALTNDSFTFGLLLGQTGVGSFKNTFPNH